MTHLTITGLRKRFGAVGVLHDVALDARNGEIHALLGENGAGKSTLIRILSGVTRPDAGAIRLDGRALPFGFPSASIRAGIRTVYQELSTIGNLTVAENLLYGREPSVGGLVRFRRLRADAASLLERFGLERIDVRAPASDLDLGDRQLLEVVKALRDQPRVLILDEATSALSSTDSEWVLGHARRVADAGGIVLLITHRMAEVESVADRLTVLRGGAAVLTGKPGEFDDDTLIDAMLGRRVDRLYPRRNVPQGNTVLTVRGLRVGTAGPVDLDVRRGEILGVGGLQGQGQREVLRGLAGVSPWADGTAELAGAAYRPSTPREALARHVAYVPEDRQREGLFLTHTVRANITAAALNRFARHGVIDRGAERRGAAIRAEEVGLAADRLRSQAGTLSGGNQQKVVLAKALLGQPEVLLLHDCTRGVDVGTKAEIFEMVMALAGNGAAVLFYSSDLSELAHLCHRVAVMVEGRVTAVLDQPGLDEEAILLVAVGRSRAAGMVTA